MKLRNLKINGRSHLEVTLPPELEQVFFVRQGGYWLLPDNTKSHQSFYYGVWLLPSYNGYIKGHNPLKLLKKMVWDYQQICKSGYQVAKETRLQTLELLKNKVKLEREL